MPDFHFRYFRSFQIDPYSPSFFLFFFGGQKNKKKRFIGVWIVVKLKGGERQEKTHRYSSLPIILSMFHTQMHYAVQCQEEKKIVIEFKEKKNPFCSSQS